MKNPIYLIEISLRNYSVDPDQNKLTGCYWDVWIRRGGRESGKRYWRASKSSLRRCQRAQLVLMNRPPVR